MKLFTLKDTNTLKYVHVFETNDFPLSFIGEIRGIQYLFYIINASAYFVIEYTPIVKMKLLELKNFAKFFNELLNKERSEIYILEFLENPEAVKFTKVEESTLDWMKYLPKSDTLLNIPNE